jgi:hypothetical protein
MKRATEKIETFLKKDFIGSFDDFVNTVAD